MLRLGRITNKLWPPSRARGVKDNRNSGRKRAGAEAVKELDEDEPHKQTCEPDASTGTPCSLKDMSSTDSTVTRDSREVHPRQEGEQRRTSRRETPPDLALRRQQEKDFVRYHDTAEADVWYIIDRVWLNEWKAFVARDGPLPKPIDNSRLLDAHGHPRSGLQIVNDYRGINREIWTYWSNRYGGGPVIRRRTLDIYSPSIDDDRGSSRPDLDGKGRMWPSDTSRPSSIRSKDRLLSQSPGPRAPSGPVFRSNEPVAVDMPSPRKKSLCCDRCDGPHETERCHVFKKPRDKHPDATCNFGKGRRGDSSEGAVIVRNAKVVQQPGDGSCLFHSLSFGLEGASASSLRREICSFIGKNPDMTIADTSIKDWIHYDSGGSVQSYALKMSENTWGGGIEMAALSLMKNVNVHVYERCREGYMRISAFEAKGATKTINVIYQGRMHYDAILL